MVLSADEFETLAIETYPNPTQDRWNLRTTQIINSVEVYDILGKQVLSLKPKTREVEIDGSSLRTGLYFAKVRGDNGSATLKLVKK